MIKAIKANIPNAITCLNLISGCLACIFAFKGQEPVWCLTGYEMAFVAIGIAAVFDFCDGAAARLLHAYSLLGKELDSLSDLISFGLAPAMLMFNTMNDNNGGSWVSCAALTIVVCGALRLAKFNVDDRQTESFIGLPIPANAIFWVGMCSLINAYGYPGDAVMVALVLVLSIMMVSRMRMFSLKFKNFRWHGNARRFVIIAVAALLIIFCGVPGLALTIMAYILISLLTRSRED